jgi:hypothetical protein
MIVDTTPVRYSSIKEAIEFLNSAKPVYVISQYMGTYKMLQATNIRPLENGIDVVFQGIRITDELGTIKVSNVVDTYYMELYETEYTEEYTNYNDKRVNLDIMEHLETIHKIDDVPLDYFNISMQGYTQRNRTMIYDYGFLAVEK